MGDGVLAYFGYPKAHEDDAERAVRAGLAVIEAMGDVSAREGPSRNVELAVRVGIATGPVVVGDLIGEGASQESAVVGETPNLAARLQGLAEINTMLIAPATKRLAGGVFDYRDVGERNLKGIADPVRVWEVVGESGVESRFEASRRVGMTPLIGRNEEVDLLLSRWQRAFEGEGQLILLSGEPGIGKSRITEALLEHAVVKPHVSLRYYCSPYHSDTALYPVVGQLRRAAGIATGDSVTTKLDKIEALLGRDDDRHVETVSLLAALLSVPADERYPPPRLTPQAQKARTLAALVARLEILASDQPVLIVLEDAHWLDPTTTELFGLIIERLHRLPILLLITYRPEFAPPWIGYETQLTSLTLNRLGRNQGWSMVERIAGGKTLPAEVLEQTLLKTDGVPLFVEEFTRTVLESDLLVDAGDHYELAGPLPDQIIPATLHDSLMYRLDRQPSVKEVALVGSVIGREFSHELLARVISLHDDALETGLSQLVESGLAFRRGTPPDATYTFKHALVQDTAYQSLLKSRRRQLHARVAAVLVEHFPQSAATEPELLAHHFSAAVMAVDAIPHWLAAGRKALMGSSLPEAVSHLTKGLELATTIEDEQIRAECELEVRTALGAATMALHGWPAPEVRTIVEPACELIEMGHGGAETFTNIWNLWLHFGCRAEHHEGLTVVDRMLEYSNVRNDPTLTLVSSFTAAMANLWVGNYAEAESFESATLEIYDFERDKDLVLSYNHDAKNTTLSWASHRIWAQGFPDKARALADAAVEHAREVGHPFNLCWTLGNSGITFGRCGDFSAVGTMVDELRRIARDQNLFFIEAYMAAACMSQSAAQVGNYDVAYDQGVQTEQVWGAVGGRFWSPVMKAHMAEACLHLERSEEAVELIERAIGLIESTGELMCAEEIYRIAGLVELKHSGDEAAAESFFERSFEYSRKHSTKSFELRTAMALARLWRDQGKAKEALDLLSPIYDWFTEGFDTVNLRDAKELLDQMQPH
jgi:tetratricopeptide (TPR) repeat protein